MKRSLVIILTVCLSLCITQCRFMGLGDASTKKTELETIAAPSGLSAIAASSAQIDLAWTDNSGNETGFQIVRSTAGVNDTTISISSNLTSYSDTVLAASTVYTYKVRAVAGDRYSEYSESVPATTHVIPAAAPSAPSGLAATATSFDKISLTWTDNSDNENSFVIQRKTTGDFGPLVEVNANITSYTDINLQPSTTYTYRLLAKNPGGSSAYTNEDSDTTMSLPVASLIADHTRINRHLLSNSAIAKVVSNLKIYYGHTSHGSQIIDGINGLKTFDARFANTPYIHEQEGYYDLGNPDRTTWATLTRTYLNSNKDINVVMWSWCAGVSNSSEQQIQDYLNLMTKLEGEYPNVKFVYMTGHLDGSGVNGNLNKRNEQIRNYCKTNNKFLYDFADIESYDPDGLVNYMELLAYDDCYYDTDGVDPNERDKNWATDWQKSHKLGTDWYNCTCVHSVPLNGNMKAYAAWYLWTVIAEQINPAK